MEGLKKLFRDVSKDIQEKSGISSSSLPESPYNFSSKQGLAALSSSSSDQSRLLVTRPPRQSVSVWTCSKLCAVFFIAGVFVGYTLKRRVRRWASKLLKRLKDD